MAQLEFQRQVDSYLEAKIKHVLQEVDENGNYSVSVDATIDQDEVKITTEDVLPAADPDSGFRSNTGLVVREHTSSRRDVPPVAPMMGAASAVATAGGMDSQSRDVDYQVGRRVEQVVTKPGAIQRLSIAVVGHTSSKSSTKELQSLVEHAVGASAQRGDSVAVVLLPPVVEEARPAPGVGATAPSPASDHPMTRASPQDGAVWHAILALFVLAVLGAILVGSWRVGRAAESVRREPTKSKAELEAMAQRINAWLNEGDPDARGA
jgi:flagellar M-ring protein FliF